MGQAGNRRLGSNNSQKGLKALYLEVNGASRRTRTDDLPLTKRLLYQLSYAGQTLYSQICSHFGSVNLR